MKKTIKFGSRKSALALAQTKLVMDSVREAHPELETELVPMETTGDRNMKPFSDVTDKFGIKGLFTQELEEALLSGKIDVAVHSLKDMPMFQDERLPLVAWSKREDARDVLVLRPGLTELPEEALTGCSSERRRVQLQKLFPGIRIKPVRGNVNTRLRKLDEGEFDALVLAAAGLKRLRVGGCISRYFERDEIIPAPGLGIMGSQGRADEDYYYLDAFSDSEGETASRAERAFSAELGGGCTAPVGAWLRSSGESFELCGFYADDEKQIARRGKITGLCSESATLAVELARRLKGDD